MALLVRCSRTIPSPLLLTGLLVLAGCSDETLPSTDAGGADGARDVGGGSDTGPDCAFLDCSSLDGPCQEGVCDPETGGCRIVLRADGTSCDDEDRCTSGDRCAGGVCAGEAVDCAAAGDGCNTGACDPATGECAPVPVEDGTTCDDGSLCTTGDTCVGGVCSGEIVDCSASSDTCHVGECDPATGGCSAVPVADGTACAFDRDRCTIDECSAGSCGATRRWCEFTNGTTTDTPLRGNPAGGTLFEDSCGPNTVIAGVIVMAEPSRPINGVRFLCGPLELRGDNPFTAVVRIDMETDPLRGQPLGGMFMAECPPGQVVVGFGGKSGSLVDELVLRCAPLDVTLADGGLVVGVGPTTDIVPVPPGPTGGSPFPQTDCPAGTVAVEGRGRAGMYIDAFGLGCAVPSLSGGVTRLLQDCDAASPVVDRHAGQACRNAPPAVSFVDLAPDVAAVTLFQDPDCTGPSLRLTVDGPLCGRSYDGTDVAVNDNVGSYRLEY